MGRNGVCGLVPGGVLGPVHTGLYHRLFRGVETRGAQLLVEVILLFWRLRQEAVLYTMSFLTLNTSYWVPHVRRRNQPSTMAFALSKASA